MSKLRTCKAVDLFTIYVFMAWKRKNVRFYLYLPSQPVSSNRYLSFPFFHSIPVHIPIMHLKVNLIISNRNPFVQLLFVSGLYARCFTPTHLSVHKSCFIYLNWTVSTPLCTYDKFYLIKPSLHNTIDSYSTARYISNMFRPSLAIIGLTKFGIN